MTTAFTEKLEKIFFGLLIVNPFFDLIGGLYLFLTTFGLSASDLESDIFTLTPSLIFRMLVLLVFVIYTVAERDKQVIFAILPVGVAWCFTVLGEFLFASQFSLLADAQYIVKFIFNMAVLLIYWRVFQHKGLSREELLAKLNWIIAFTLMWISISILLCSILGIGYTTYADHWGYRGSRGFFYSGNDVTAIIMLLTPLAISFFLRLDMTGLNKRQRLFWLASPALSMATLFILGTKTAFLAIAIMVFCFLGYTLYQRLKKGDRKLFKRMLLIIAAMLIVILIMVVLTQASTLLAIGLSFDKILEIKDDLGLGGMLLSGRGSKLAEVFDQFRDGGIFSWLFGIGRGTQERIIEMDLFECVLFYGIVGAFCMLWLYAKTGIRFLVDFFRRPDVMGLACFLSLGMCVAYLTIAGHVLFSVSSGFYFAFVLLYSRLYQCKSIDDLQLLGKKQHKK